MASEYTIHKPYVLATLPRPLDFAGGKIVTREVYGQVDDGKKRKRTEIVVGVDGEATSIYDISSSRLLTSYPIPPQDSFSCSPYSIRARRTGSTDRVRHTYIITHNAISQNITLFKDIIHRDGRTTSTIVTKTLPPNRAVYITSSANNVLVANRMGDVQSLAAETLETQWISSLQPIVQDTLVTSIDSFEIEHAVSASMTDLRSGILKRRLEHFNTLPKRNEKDSELLLFITKTSTAQQELRHVSIIHPSSVPDSSELQRLNGLDVTPLSLSENTSDNPSFQFDVPGGSLLTLSNARLTVYDLTGSSPKPKCTIHTGDVESFSRLPRPFALCCSHDSIRLYNYLYSSIHAQVTIDFSDLPLESQQPQSCQLIDFFRTQELAVALVDNILISFQVEMPKYTGKRKKHGLLIDSIGRGISLDILAKRPRHALTNLESSERDSGSITERTMREFQMGIEKADKLLSEGDLVSWEDLLKAKFKMFHLGEHVATNGNHVNGIDEATTVPEWKWKTHDEEYPYVDRFWVLYAIDQVFSLDFSGVEDSVPSLCLLLPNSNVTTYLIVAGHLNMSNLRTALRQDLEGRNLDDKSLAGNLIRCLEATDPSMNLLLNYIEATNLGAVEFLIAIKALLLSMGIISNNQTSQMKLLGDAPTNPEDGDMDLDHLEREIAKTELYLGDESSSRSRGLNCALTRLSHLPPAETIQALRTALDPQDILSLIQLLKFELIRGAWTSNYTDSAIYDLEGNEPQSEEAVSLIANLLGLCIDAIGSGGWFFNDAAPQSNPVQGNDFITDLNLQVEAALLGVQQAANLRETLSEVLPFHSALNKSKSTVWEWTLADAKNQRSTDKPMTLTWDEKDAQLLPLGLKTKTAVSKKKVVRGGEVVERSARETGHLISQKVAAYSLEKLTI